MTPYDDVSITCADWRNFTNPPKRCRPCREQRRIEQAGAQL